MKHAVSISLLPLVALSIALPVAATAADKPVVTSAPTPNAADQRTYTAGRRNAEIPTITAADTVAPNEGQSCPLPADAQSRQARIGRIVFRNNVAVCEAATVVPVQPGKSISDKGVSSTKGR